MPKLYRILGLVVVLCILVTTITFAFGFFLIIAAAASLVGLYRYYILKKGYQKSKIKSKSKGYSSGEIIDMPVEDQKIKR